MPHAVQTSPHIAVQRPPPPITHNMRLTSHTTYMTAQHKQYTPALLTSDNAVRKLHDLLMGMSHPLMDTSKCKPAEQDLQQQPPVTASPWSAP
mmetsp:Transcript_10853/g.23360  ORF Transcript_10853/g.23360 Transcript_10853/m.23360 type:complete len:93 (+) Transcript_10853:600-878(+)